MIVRTGAAGREWHGFELLRRYFAKMWTTFGRLSSPRVKAEVYDAFARAGAKAVVAEETPPTDEFADWQRLGDTHYYVHFLAMSGK